MSTDPYSATNVEWLRQAGQPSNIRSTHANGDTEGYNPDKPDISQEDFRNTIQALQEQRKQVAAREKILTDLKKLLMIAADTPNAELEVHIGRIKPSTGGFDSQVSEKYFTDMLEKFSRFAGWESTTDGWHRIEELIFPHNVRMRRSPPDNVAHFLQKSTVQRTHIEMKDGKYDFSVVLNSENPYHLNYGDPVRCRFKERKNFVHGHFVYSLSKVWELDKDFRAENKGRPKFEVELEVLPFWFSSADVGDDSHRVSRHTSEADLQQKATVLAESILVKCADLVGKLRHAEGECKWQSDSVPQRTDKGRVGEFRGRYSGPRNAEHQPRRYHKGQQMQARRSQPDPYSSRGGTDRELFAGVPAVSSSSTAVSQSSHPATQNCWPPQSSSNPPMMVQYPQNGCQQSVQQAPNCFNDPAFLAGISQLYHQYFLPGTTMQTMPTQQQATNSPLSSQLPSGGSYPLYNAVHLDYTVVNQQQLNGEDVIAKEQQGMTTAPSLNNLRAREPRLSTNNAQQESSTAGESLPLGTSHRPLAATVQNRSWTPSRNPLASLASFN